MVVPDPFRQASQADPLWKLSLRHVDKLVDYRSPAELGIPSACVESPVPFVSQCTDWLEFLCWFKYCRRPPRALTFDMVFFRLRSEVEMLPCPVC